MHTTPNIMCVRSFFERGTSRRSSQDAPRTTAGLPSVTEGSSRSVSSTASRSELLPEAAAAEPAEPAQQHSSAAASVPQSPQVSSAPAAAAAAARQQSSRELSPQPSPAPAAVPAEQAADETPRDPSALQQAPARDAAAVYTSIAANGPASEPQPADGRAEQELQGGFSLQGHSQQVPPTPWQPEPQSSAEQSSVTPPAAALADGPQQPAQQTLQGPRSVSITLRLQVRLRSSLRLSVRDPHADLGAMQGVSERLSELTLTGEIPEASSRAQEIMGFLSTLAGHPPALHFAASVRTRLLTCNTRQLTLLLCQTARSAFLAWRLCLS